MAGIPPGHDGDGLVMGLRAGAALRMPGEAWWTAAIQLPGHDEGGEQLTLNVVRELARPGAILVNQAGRRFVDEASPYNDLGKAFLRFDVTRHAFPNAWSATTLGDTSEEMWDQIIDVNVKSAYLFAHAALPVTRSLARDYTGRGIRSNCVCPGILESVTSDRRAEMDEAALARRSRHAAELVPMGREGRYREAADAVVFLASTRAGFASGSAFLLDGGMLA